MSRRNKKTNAKIYELGLMLGLNKNDMDDVLKDTSTKNEQLSFSMGPHEYCSALYGTVSINDFEKQSKN